MANDTILTRWYMHPMVQAWTRFDGIHHEKAKEACNVRVVRATDVAEPHK
jgi:hypothetical protein